jgi:hypothetical protein
LSYNSETNKIKDEGEYRERKRNRRKKKKTEKSTKENSRERWWNDQGANQTAKPLKEGKQNKTQKLKRK